MPRLKFYKPSTTKKLKNAIQQYVVLGRTSYYPPISQWDTSLITDMSYLFENCYEFNGDISEWNVANVTDMRYMFKNCLLFNCNLSKWDVRNVRHMTGMFSSCISFHNDISQWNVNRMTDVTDMFLGCRYYDYYLTNLDNRLKLMFGNTFKYIQNRLIKIDI